MTLPIPFSAVVPRVHPVRGRLPALHPAEEVPRPEVAEVLGARGAELRIRVHQGPVTEAQRQIGKAGNQAENRRGEKRFHLSCLKSMGSLEKMISGQSSHLVDIIYNGP